MNNELKIKPLLKYEVWIDGDFAPEIFTADSHQTFEGHAIFYRTGNVIREYLYGVHKIVVTPEEDG